MEVSISHRQKNIEEIGLVENTSFLFLHGLRRYKSKSRVTIPIPLILMVGTTMVCLMVAGGVVNYERTDWVQLCINLIFIPVSIICGTLILRHRSTFAVLSKVIDGWWSYNFLDDKVAEMREKAVNWMDWYGRYYYSGMYIACLMNLVPLLKRCILGKSEDPMSSLMYPCWTPLDLGSWSGFIFTYMFQFTSMYLSYFSFGNTCFYLTTAYVSLGYQAQLVGVAIMSADDRSRKMIEKDELHPTKRQELLESYLKKEIINTIKHYQKLQRCAKELKHIFSPLAILAYNIGFLVLSLSGIRLATETDKLQLVNSFMNTVVTLGNQFIISFICELLTGEVENLGNTLYNCNWTNMPISCQKYIYTFQMMVNYMPTLVTLTGMKTNFENFTKVLNTSYCYFSLILSMKNK